MTKQDELMSDATEQSQAKPPREKIFNIPAVILAFVVILVGVHLYREYVLNHADQLDFLLRFAFVPGRYMVDGSQLPLYGSSRYFTPISYAFLHGDWNHLLVNTLWLVAFGSAVAARFGVVRFVIFSLFSAVAGAFVHFLCYPNGITPMVGASAIVSAYMGAAVRFAFVPGRMGRGHGALQQPALSLVDSFKNPSSFAFIAVWFGVNYLFGSGLVPVIGEGTSIAWQAHIGGFLFGLFAFMLFDPKQK